MAKRESGLYVQAYLPRELGELAKEAQLPFSRLLRAAVVRELEQRGHPICAVCDRPMGLAPRFTTEDGQIRHLGCKQKEAA